MALDDTLSGWTGPSSLTEQDKQDRTERMIRSAVDSHAGFDGCSITVYAKGSYANNTNVRTDSDVDIAVQCHEARYWDHASVPNYLPGEPYRGVWTPSKLRSELGLALRNKFPGQVDDSGSTAFCIHSGTTRVDADVVPCFDYTYHSGSSSRDGTKVFKKNSSALVNYPEQQKVQGNAKNVRTNHRYKMAVRAMKRIENAMVNAKVHREVPSFFVECLVYNCPDVILMRTTWTEVVRGILGHVWEGLQGAEPSQESERWLEVNECMFLFHSGQAWSRADGRDFAKAAWNYLGYS